MKHPPTTTRCKHPRVAGLGPQRAVVGADSRGRHAVAAMHLSIRRLGVSVPEPGAEEIRLIPRLTLLSRREIAALEKIQSCRLGAGLIVQRLVYAVQRRVVPSHR